MEKRETGSSKDQLLQKRLVREIPKGNELKPPLLFIKMMQETFQINVLILLT